MEACVTVTFYSLFASLPKKREDPVVLEKAEHQKILQMWEIS